MDSEINTKSNNCQAEESSKDSSQLNNNNNSPKDGVKKVLENSNEDESAMEVDKQDGHSPDGDSSEAKNSDSEISNENVVLNHEQNNVDEKNVSSETVDNKLSDEMDSEPTENKVCEENKQNTDKNADTASATNKNSIDHKTEEELNSKADKPMDVDVPSKTEKSEEKDSSKDSVRPADKDTSASSQPVGTNEKAAMDVSSSKSDSGDKESNKGSQSEGDKEAKKNSKSAGDKETKSKSDKESKTKSDKEANENSKSESNKGTKEKSKSEDDKEANETSKLESDKETKEISKSEVANNEAVAKENKGKEANENSSAKESKSEHSKKDGEEKSKKKKSKTCEECGVKKGLKFQVLFKGKTRFLCSDTCFKNFKSKQMQTKPPPEKAIAPKPEEKSPGKCSQCQKDLSGDQRYYPVVGEIKPLCSEDCLKKYQAINYPTKSCSQCKKVIENPQNPDILNWETMVFCNEDCLGKYQSFLGSHCTCCQSPVPQASLGKYCVCFGADIRQFCSCSCLDDFKKNLKVCSFCQTDLSAGVDSFLAPVGDKGQFKDFCSQNCMERYEIMNNISKNTPQTQVCSHCKKQGTFKTQVKHENQTYAICSDLCAAGFRCAHKIKDKMCYTCFNFFSMSPEKGKEFSFKFDGQIKQFCTKACMTLFVLSHRRIVACVSCKVKKYNFDMIEKLDANNITQIFCSLNCLSLYRVSVNATSSKSVKCDNCTKNLPAQYHLTMSDGSVRNFCTYNCVMLFQNQYTNVCTLTTTSTTRQTSSTTVSVPASKTSAAASTPVISNVVSLAPPGTPRPPTGPALIRTIVPPKLVTTRPALQPLAIIGSKPASSTTASTSTVVTTAGGQQVLREVIVKPPAPKSQKNKSVACKPIMQHKGINVKPQPCHKAVQTDDSPRPILLPVPVPYYVPVPVHMFSRPVPCPVPFPIPMFLPIPLPPKDVSNQDKITSGENSIQKRRDESSTKGGTTEGSCKENDDKKLHPHKGDEYSSASDECNDANEDEYAFKDGKNHRRKRHAHHKNKSHKKSRNDDPVNDEGKSHNAVAADENRNTSVQNDHVEPAPRLKFMFGVNAWKHWVLQKNKQMERGSQSSRKFKLFKTDLLTLPPDELNYSLSLFVKEVRKPEGDEYSAGSLYYLSLGIQKYLFENGRIDNIFSDPYYEKFTECLHEILDTQDRMNAIEGFSGSRIEEEVLWESKQLGAHSPYALLNTIMYFNTKCFKLKTTDDHCRLSFNHMFTVFDRKSTDRPDKIGVLRYYPNGIVCDNLECDHNNPDCIDGTRRDPNENTFKEVDNAKDSMRCPVRLYEFYLSKCPDSCRGRSDLFYLHPERSCVPDSAVWYSAQPLGRDVIRKMIQRIKLVKEVHEN